jgi:chromosome segregation ATPase
MRIFSKFAQVKAEGGIRKIVELLASVDPKGMSEAELRVMDSKLSEIGQQVVFARNTANKEQQDLDKILALRNSRIQAAEILQKQIEKADGSERASKEASLGTLLTLIENMHEDVEREESEANYAKQDLADIESAHAEAVTRLKTARSELTKAERDMASAKRDRSRAESSANTAAIAAGVRQSTSNLTSALDAMKNIAQADRDAAAAARLKADALKPSKPEQEDPNIASALADAQGIPPAPKSAADRLAALKAGSAKKAA